ncbi:hypothetical protein ACFYKX_05625 [Cytobacillus sp. FJAT-54145]|uniref:MFS transporter n=1 Tax=Cytobacillus spartinae TaxID=3299023 RepID=A0ABW6K910_9BACI
MIKKILQSPIFNAFLVLALGVILLGNYYPSYIPDWLILDPLYLLIPIFLLFAFIPFYNKRNPKDPIKPTVIPMEFREEDEGLQWITFKATRKVYMFFAHFIPIAIMLIALFNHIVYLPIIILMVMGITQYVIYWFEVRKHS